MLTEKQLNLLRYVEKYHQDKGFSPSFDEMREALNLKSKSGIHRLLVALEERGFIRKLPNRARALEVIKIPNQEIDGSATENTPQNANDNMVSLPYLGKIAAGRPIDAIADNTNYIDVPQHLISNGTFYALEIEGDSMIHAGIIDGDTVIIEKASHAEKGDIIVALVERDEATLKYYHPENGKITLKAANPDFQDQIYTPEQIEIQGKLHALLRQY